MRYLLLLILLTRTAYADDATAKIADKVVAMTNAFLDQHIDLLTHDMLQLRVDAEVVRWHGAHSQSHRVRNRGQAGRSAVAER